MSSVLMLLNVGKGEARVCFIFFNLKTPLSRDVDCSTFTHEKKQKFALVLPGI